MTFTKTIATFALTLVTLFSANIASAQYAYSNSWETQSSWNSSWSTGPNGTHRTYDEQSSQKSNESTTIGGRTISNSQDHSQQSGYAQGADQHGVYNNTYAKEQGTSVSTDINRINGPYGGQAVQTQQLTNTYDNSQGMSQNWGTDGSYNQSGFEDRSQAQKLLNDVRGRDAFGNRFGGQLIKEIGQKQGSTYGMGFDRYGNQISGQQSKSGSMTQKQNFRQW